MHKNICRFLAITLGCALLGGCAAAPPREPVTITVWHYYNGAQMDAFSTLVDEFNATRGKELGVVVANYSQGSVTDLAASVTSAARKDVGAPELPNIFAAYADTAYELDQMGVVADLTPYLNEEQRALYVDGYLEEGHFADGALKIFPVAKSTEILLLNQTDWQRFADDSGAGLDALQTCEGVTATAKAYYEWSDALTPDIANDGKAFFGRDAFANYMLIGAQQLGCEILSVQNGVCTLNYDKAVVRTLWDNYYLPMVAGWFSEDNRFRSDDVKLGEIIACVGSTSGSTFFPTSVTVSDTESYPIQTLAQPAPIFAGGEAFAVQQGAGMLVTQAEEAEITASVEFLQWFTDAQRNAAFSVKSGYLPVTKQASSQEFLQAAMDEAGTTGLLRSVLEIGAQTTRNHTMYTPGAFAQGTMARALLNNAMPDKAKADRAELLALLEQGADYNETLAAFASDENFDAWYTETLTALQQLCG